MKKKFREQSIDRLLTQASQSLGCFVISSKGNSLKTLLQKRKRLQNTWLNIGDKNIAIHPMT